jgi:nicotinate dehydrogenase subunit A
MSTITVNGTSREVVADPDVPLLLALRDELGLTAAKYGCGLDQCGSCTVLLAGRRAASCQITVGDVGDREVTTLEALVATPEGQIVLDALAGTNAGQCGYCLPGIAVTLIALAQRRQALPRSEVATALDPHLCRCGSQPRILTAAVAALEQVARTRG